MTKTPTVESAIDVLDLIAKGNSIQVRSVTISRKPKAKQYSVVTSTGMISKWSKAEAAKFIQEEIDEHSFEQHYKEVTAR